MSVQLFNLYGVYASAQQEVEDFPAAESDAQWQYDIMDNGLAYRVHEFTLGENMDFIVTNEGDFERLIIGAGGSGGGDDGGGGGGGQVIENGVFLTEGIYSVTVGDGGDSAQNQNPGLTGESSSFAGTTAEGGGGGNSANGTGQQGYNAGGGSGANQNPTSPSGGNFGGSGTSGRGGGGAGAGQNGGNADGSDPGKGGDGTLSSITGISVRYGAGGAGAENDNPQIGGDFGGGKSNQFTRGAGGKSGFGTGGGANASTSQRTGKGGYGRVVVRHQISSVDPDFGNPPPQPAVTKRIGFFDANRRVFDDSLPFWGNIIRSLGTQAQLRDIYDSTGQPVIWAGFGFDSGDTENQWISKIQNNASNINYFGDDIEWIFIQDEPELHGFTVAQTEHLVELCREVLKFENGRNYKFGFTTTQSRAYSWGTNGGNFSPLTSNADIIAINNYVYRPNFPPFPRPGNVDNQTGFNSIIDLTIDNMQVMMGPNTRLWLTMQGFYGYDIGANPGFNQPHEDSPYWWCEYVVNSLDIDGILVYEWWNRIGVNGIGTRDSTMATYWANLQDAYNIHFANQ